MGGGVPRLILPLKSWFVFLIASLVLSKSTLARLFRGGFEVRLPDLASLLPLSRLEVGLSYTWQLVDAGRGLQECLFKKEV